MEGHATSISKRESAKLAQHGSGILAQLRERWMQEKQYANNRDSGRACACDSKRIPMPVSVASSKGSSEFHKLLDFSYGG